MVHHYFLKNLGKKNKMWTLATNMSWYMIISAEQSFWNSEPILPSTSVYCSSRYVCLVSLCLFSALGFIVCKTINILTGIHVAWLPQKWAAETSEGRAGHRLSDRFHPRVRRPGEVILVTSGAWRLMRGWTLIILLSQFNRVGARISNRFKIFDISFKGFNVNDLSLQVSDTSWYSMTAACWNAPVSNNRKVVRNHIRCWHRDLAPFRILALCFTFYNSYQI